MLSFLREQIYLLRLEHLEVLNTLAPTEISLDLRKAVSVFLNFQHIEIYTLINREVESELEDLQAEIHWIPLLSDNFQRLEDYFQELELLDLNEDQLKIKVVQVWKLIFLFERKFGIIINKAEKLGFQFKERNLRLS